MNATQMAPSKWGRARFGGSSALLISLSLLVGLLLSAGAGVLFARLNAPEHFLLAASLMTAGVLPAFSAACWALLLDRNTLRGATRKPELSVESQWYDKVAVAVFQDLLLVCGLGGALFSFMPVTVSLGLALAGVVLVAMVDFAVRYLVIKKVEG